MILTLTPNPSVDQTVALDGPLVHGAVHRVVRSTTQSGGKGVNISRAAVAAGVPTIALFPAPPDDPYVAELRAAGIDCRPEESGEPVRVNIAVTEPDGTTTKLNSPGSEVTPALLDRLADRLVELAGAAHDQDQWLVLAGSLPPGCPEDWYADLVVAAHRAGARVAVDTSDAPLAALARRLSERREAAPDLMKPNGAELASLTGDDPDALEADPEQVARAAHRLVEQGVGTVLATLGPYGAVLVTAGGAWHATSPPVEVLSTVGAGDSSLFGYLLGEHRGLADPGERLALAVAYGSAAAALPGTTIPTPTHTHPEQARVRRLHPEG